MSGINNDSTRISTLESLLAQVRQEQAAAAIQRVVAARVDPAINYGPQTPSGLEHPRAYTGTVPERDKGFLFRQTGPTTGKISAGYVLVGATPYLVPETTITVSADALAWYAHITVGSIYGTLGEVEIKSDGNDFPSEISDGWMDVPLLKFTWNDDDPDNEKIRRWKQEHVGVILAGGATVVKLKWDDGSALLIDDRPRTEPGMYWHVARIEEHGTEVWVVMEQECLKPYAIAGYRSYTGNLVLTGSGGEQSGLSVATGLVTGVSEATTYTGIDPETGAEVTVTVNPDGTVSGYDGMLSSFNEATGAEEIYRITADGKVRY